MSDKIFKSTLKCLNEYIEDRLNPMCEVWGILDQICNGEYSFDEGFKLIESKMKQFIIETGEDTSLNLKNWGEVVGTNYYAVRNRPTTDDPIHIGKCSYGWLFHFQSQNNTFNNPPIIWNTYDQVKDWLYKNTVESNEYVIMNEYDEIVSFEDFCKIVDSQQTDEFCLSNDENFDYHVRDVNGYRFSDGYFS